MPAFGQCFREALAYLLSSFFFLSFQLDWLLGWKASALNGGGRAKAELSVAELRPGVCGEALGHVTLAEQNPEPLFQSSDCSLGR